LTLHGRREPCQGPKAATIVLRFSLKMVCIIHYFRRPTTVIVQTSQTICQHGLKDYVAARERREQEWNCLVESYNQLAKELKSEWDSINKGHQDLEAEKNALCQENGGVSVSDSDILDINAGGEIIRVSRGTLTQIKGTVLEAIFSGRWEKMLLRDGNGDTFLDVNPECFRCIIDYLTECKIATPEHPPRLPTTDDEHRESLQRLCMVWLDCHSRWRFLTLSS
jgi:uncharacterized protein (UPF0335 family)